MKLKELLFNNKHCIISAVVGFFLGFVIHSGGKSSAWSQHDYAQIHTECSVQLMLVGVDPDVTKKYCECAADEMQKVISAKDIDNPSKEVQAKAKAAIEACASKVKQ